MAPNAKKGKAKQLARAIANRVVADLPKRPQRKKPNRKKGNKKNKGGKGGILRQYIEGLNNPFNVAPVAMGYGTLVPTQTFTVTWNGTKTLSTVTTPPETAFTVVGMPLCGKNASNIGFLNFCQGIDSTVNYTTQECSQSAQVSTLYESARCVSMAIRVTPLLSGTDKPGVIGAGLYSVGEPSTSASPTNGYFSSTLAMNLPGTRRLIGKDAVQATWRPVDNTDFEFDSQIVATAPALAGITNSAFPYITCNNYPPGTVLMIEAVANFEGLVGSKNTALLDTAQRTLQGGGVSLENLQGTIRKGLGPTVLASQDSNYSWMDYGNHVLMAGAALMGQRIWANGRDDGYRGDERVGRAGGTGINPTEMRQDVEMENENQIPEWNPDYAQPDQYGHTNTGPSEVPSPYRALPPHLVQQGYRLVRDIPNTVGRSLNTLNETAPAA